MSDVAATRRRRRRSASPSTALRACFLALLSLAQTPSVQAESSTSPARHIHVRHPLHRPVLGLDRRTEATSHKRIPRQNSALKQSAASATSNSASSVANSSPTTYPIIDPRTTDPTWTFPLPFDTVLGTNFTKVSCPSFFSTFLNSPSFQACRPLSLTIGTSNGFFEAALNATTVLPYVVDQACSVPSTCSETMTAYAKRMQAADTCGPDLAAGNALAHTALNGLINYQMMNRITCLKNTATHNYCMTEAASGDDTTELYWYSLAQGTQLPSASTVNCGQCLSDMLSIYSEYAGNSTYAISKVYGTARTTANTKCGPNFAKLVNLTSSSQSIDTHLSVLMAALIISTFKFFS